MRAGRLDRRIVIERARMMTNEFGEEIATWEPLATVWASREDIRDAERYAAQQVGAEVTSRFQIRWSPTVASVSPGDHLWHGPQAFNITAVKEMGRREGLELTAVAAAG